MRRLSVHAAADHNARGFRTYICKAQHGMGRCPAPAYAGAAALEEFVSRAVLALDDAHVVPAARSSEVVAARARVEELRDQVLRLVAQLRRSRHPHLIEPELEHAEEELEEAEARLADLEEREAASGGRARTLAEILDRGTEGERRAVVAAYLDRVVLRRGSEPLSGRVLLLLRGEEARFHPLPGRGRKVPMRSWPEFPLWVSPLDGTGEEPGQDVAALALSP